MTQTPQALDCFEAGPELVPVADAFSRILERIQTVAEIETVDLFNALDRVLAEDIVATFDVPPHTNSAMDGYAVAGSELPSSETKAFCIAGTAYAGAPFNGELRRDEAVRIMTGAIMPAGTDTVVIQENVEVDGEQVKIGPGNETGQNTRAVGEDIRKGQVVLAKGTRIAPPECGVIASLGLDSVKVTRRLKVAVMSTGNELRSAGETLRPGTIYDSNRYLLHAMLCNLGADVIDLGIIRDEPQLIQDALRRGGEQADVIISSAGVSTGQADYVSETLAKTGDLTVWRIAIRPGRPFAQGCIHGTEFFGLPGNPVAVIVTFYQLVQPALRLMMGDTNIEPAAILQAECTTRFRKKTGRSEVYRAILERDQTGKTTVRSTGKQGSGLLTSVSTANCFVLLDHDAESVEPGNMVDVQPFYGLF